MMNQGRPILSQDSPVREAPPTSREEIRLRNLYRKLIQSGYAEQPFIDEQDIHLPATVKVVGRTSLVLDLSDEKQLERYGQLLTSTLKRGREIIVYEDNRSFDSTAGWKVFLKIDVRAFKCLTNHKETELLIRSLDDVPEEPETEPEEDDLDPEADEEQDATTPETTAVDVEEPTPTTAAT